MRIHHAVIGAFAALLLAGCAGTDFVRPKGEELNLGVTTKEEVLKRMGDPRAKGSAVLSGESVDSVNYVYASVGAESYASGVTGVRAIELVFWKDKLVAHQFISSMKADATHFPKDKATQVKEGMTREQVLQLLGEPSGRAVFPVVGERDGEGLMYSYVETRGFTTHQRRLAVELDTRGVVKKSTFLAHGDSPTP